MCPWVEAEHILCTTEGSILASKRTPNRKFSTLTIAAAAIASGAAATVAGATGQAPAAAPSHLTSTDSSPPAAAVLTAATKPAALYSFGALEHLWMAAGGSGRRAAHAACIAEHESGGNARAISRTNDWGLWQIHNGGPRMLNPAANAATAVRMSHNGTNWSAWTTRRMC
jgi:hypothetical protein